MKYSTRKQFTPKPGMIYRNNGGGTYKCIETGYFDHGAKMQNTVSGWTLNAHGCGIYEDGSIDWDYSTEGHFEKI